MKVAKLVHNPTAGDEEHTKKELLSIVEAGGFKCKYFSTKNKGWKKIEPEHDFLIAAGGDGTVRKIVKTLLKRKVVQKSLPIGLLPLGTANNIARALNISGTHKEIVESWRHANLKKIDIGLVHNVGDSDFFLEGFGCGIFPYLILEMKKQGKDFDDPDLEMNTSLALLHEIVLSYEPRHCELEVDGTNHSGKFLMTEIMNTPSIGPNLVLAPDADPGDGELEIVLVPEKYKERFATYLTNKIAGNEEEEYRYDTLKGKNIVIHYDGTHVHVDGDVLKVPKSAELRITVKESLIEFLVPA